MKKIFFLLIAIICYYNSSAQLKDLSPAGVMMSHTHPKGGWMLNYTFMHMEMKDNFRDRSKITDERIFDHYSMAPGFMKMDMHMLMAMYGITGRLTVMVMSNYTMNSMSMQAYADGLHVHTGNDPVVSSEHMRMNTTGWGDTKLSALYKLVNGERSSLTGSLGVNIPTGNFQIDGNPHSGTGKGRYPYMMQTGTGSFDFTPAIIYLSAKNKISWSTQIAASIRPFNNAIGYHFGNEFLLNCWAGYKFTNFSSFSVRMEANHSGEMSGRDQTLALTDEPASDFRNYGGEKINSYLGLNFFVNKGWMKESKFSVEFGLPLYQDLNGIQQGNSGTLYLGYTVSLE